MMNVFLLVIQGKYYLKERILIIKMDTYIEMNNYTEVISSNSWSSDNFDCEDLTNNGLYLIFTGYILPLLSPKVRNYLHETFISIKNMGDVAGKIVSVTDYGFEKVQGLSNNGEMVEFLTRLCSKKNLTIDPKELVNLAWSFSGDTENGKRPGSEQTWNKLMKEVNRIHDLNKLQKGIKP